MIYERFGCGLTFFEFAHQGSCRHGGSLLISLQDQVRTSEIMQEKGKSMIPKRPRNNKSGLTRRQFLEAGGAVTAALFLPAASLVTAEGTSAGQRSLTLTQSGKSRYEILIGRQAGEVEKFAAQELRKYLGRITGVSLPISTRRTTHYIAVGETDASRDITVPSRYEEDDAFRMVTQNANIILKGATPLASLYAVDTFLERLGCWWFAPSTPAFNGHSEFVPRHSELVVEPLDVTEQPAMKYRVQDADHSFSMTSPADWRGLIDWMAKNRSNTLAMFIDKYEADRETIDHELALRGMRAEVGKHPITFYFLPPERYFKEHPDWYGMVNGQRETHVGHRPVMFETANPQAVATFEANIVAYLKKRPQIRVFQLWPPDGCIWSESPASKALGSPSERMRLLVGSLTRAFRSAGLKTQVEFLAYEGYTRPPKNMNFPKETIVDFCPIQRSYAVPFDDAAYPMNRKLNADLHGWLARFPGQVREYSYYARYRWDSLPVVLPSQIGHDKDYWRRIGVVGASIYCEVGNWLALEVNHLAFARALWDANFDAKRWYSHYLRARFGNSAEPLGRYFSLGTRITLGTLSRPNLPGSPSSYAPLLAQAKQAMEEARSRASGSTRWAVEKLAWQADYLSLALQLRVAEKTRQPSEKIRDLQRQIRTLTTAHANDGTCLRGNYIWLMNQRASHRRVKRVA